MLMSNCTFRCLDLLFGSYVSGVWPVFFSMSATLSHQQGRALIANHDASAYELSGHLDTGKERRY